jgi:hypothetical protein
VLKKSQEVLTRDPQLEVSKALDWAKVTPGGFHLWATKEASIEVGVLNPLSKTGGVLDMCTIRR